MTKKDYQLIAEVVKERIDKAKSYSPSQKYNRIRIIYDLITELASKLYQENPKFDYKKFYQSCGFNS